MSMSIAPIFDRSGKERSAKPEFFSDETANAMRIGLQSDSPRAASKSTQRPSI